MHYVVPIVTHGSLVSLARGPDLGSIPQLQQWTEKTADRRQEAQWRVGDREADTGFGRRRHWAMAHRRVGDGEIAGSVPVIAVVKASL